MVENACLHLEEGREVYSLLNDYLDQNKGYCPHIDTKNYFSVWCKPKANELVIHGTGKEWRPGFGTAHMMYTLAPDGTIKRDPLHQSPNRSVYAFQEEIISSVRLLLKARNS